MNTHFDIDFNRLIFTKEQRRNYCKFYMLRVKG